MPICDTCEHDLNVVVSGRVCRECPDCGRPRPHRDLPNTKNFADKEMSEKVDRAIKSFKKKIDEL